MDILIFIVITIPIFVIIPLDIHTYIKHRRSILEPIEEHVSNKTGTRGEIINVYNAYNKCSNREILVQKHLLRIYSEKTSVLDKVIDLFAKLMFPLMTFMLLFTLTWLTSVFETTSDKMDKDKLRNNISGFQEIIIEFFNKPIAYILAFISCLTFVSIISHIFIQFKNSFLKFHEDIIDRIIKERDIENSPLNK